MRRKILMAGTPADGGHPCTPADGGHPRTPADGGHPRSSAIER